MNTLPAPDGGSSPSLWTPATISSGTPRLAQAVEHLVKEAGRALGSTTILLPRTDCEAVLLQIERRGAEQMTEVEAAESVKALLGMYPARPPHDPETYANAMKTVFMASQFDFVRRVVDPVNGLPSRCKFLPTIAEVNEALVAEATRRSQIKLTALWMLREHDRRKAEEEERAKWAHLTPEDLERRRAQVAALLGPVKGDPDGKA